MTRKDFQLIANVLANTELTRAGGEGSTYAAHLEREHLVYAFATALEVTNPRFDRERFIKAARDGQGYRPGN